MLADRLRELRKSRHMTATGLAARAGVSKSFISQLESGRTSASLTTLGRIAGALGVSTGQLLAPSAAETRSVEESAGTRVLYSRQQAAPPGTRVLSSASTEVHAVVTVQPGGRARGTATAGAALVVTGLVGTVVAATDANSIEIPSGDVAILQPGGAYELSNQGSGAAVVLLAAPTPAELPELVRAAVARPELYDTVGPLRLVTMRAKRAAGRSR